MSESASRELTDQIHRLLVPLIARIYDHEQVCCDRFGVTRMEAKALYRLEPGETVPVKTVAERGLVDPSNLSPALKALEGRGFVERRQAPHDKRVRAVRLTPKGLRLRERLIECAMDGYPAVARLNDAERAQLRDLLQKLDV